MHLAMTSNIGTLSSLFLLMQTRSGITWSPCQDCTHVPMHIAGFIRWGRIAALNESRLLANDIPGGGRVVARIESLSQTLRKAFIPFAHTRLRLCVACEAPLHAWATRGNQDQIWKSIPLVFRLTVTDQRGNVQRPLVRISYQSSSETD
ncbi:hypothetical protein BDV98DRAFT_577028 [Pterulicium gracile]|uniref:Yippee domain-containing protein n=1 Tax=Pterulicium gracile TaxID=1884261 RepID=A0A5C3Q1F2_9AGAR|nr:hypothetical protein BDV98DRAFT_577028 [Pterula gracilis]